jgi:hypothetical protein
MKNLLLFTAFISIVFTGCKKTGDDGVSQMPGYKTFTIKMGDHYAGGNTPSNIETSMMKFIVKFDSSSVYTSAIPENQYDINKLYGFSDNDAPHHQFSARIGWRWSENALRLFAYVYNSGVVLSKEITTITIGSEVQCAIIISDAKYIFKVNEITEMLPRAATTVKAKGYQLYPYFGGDETAPHDISIMIKEEN